MFGHDWEPGTATVIARKSHARNSVSSSYEFIADVQPASGGPAFRATFRSTQTAYGFEPADVGGTMPVFCDVARKKVKIDENDPANRWDTGLKAERDNFDAIKAGNAAAVPAPPPTPASPSAEEMAGAREELRAAQEALQGALQSGRADMAAFLVAKTSGDELEMSRLKAAIATGSSEVQRLNGDYQQLARQGTDEAAGHPAAAAAPADPVDRLEKLADLHNRGVLTDEEFAAAKAKILAEP